MVTGSGTTSGVTTSSPSATHLAVRAYGAPIKSGLSVPEPGVPAGYRGSLLFMQCANLAERMNRVREALMPGPTQLGMLGGSAAPSVANLTMPGAQSGGASGAALPSVSGLAAGIAASVSSAISSATAILAQPAAAGSTGPSVSGLAAGIAASVSSAISSATAILTQPAGRSLLNPMRCDPSVRLDELSNMFGVQRNTGEIVSDATRNMLWSHIVGYIYEQFVEGITRLKRPPNVVLFSLDLNHMTRELSTTCTSVAPGRDRAYVEGFVRGFMASTPDELLAWAREYGLVLEAHQIRTVAAAVVNAARKKAFIDALSSIELILSGRG